MLNDTARQVIYLRAPFDLAITAAVARRLPSNVLYPIHDGELRVVMSHGDENWLIGVRQTGPRAVAYRTLGSALSDRRQATIEANVRRLLGLDVDLEPLRALLAHEPVLGLLAQRMSGMFPPRFLSLWESFVQVIPFQQVSLAAAMTMVNRLALAYGPRVRFEDKEYVGAPDVNRVRAAPITTLRECGLSATKAMALRECADWIITGKVSEDRLAGMTDAEAERLLCTLPGIGPWSAQLVLLRGMGRLGRFPVGDSGAARGLREVFAEATPDPNAAAAAALERLGAWRGYLYFMLLARKYVTAT